MAKANGLGQNLYIEGYDLSNDVGQVNGFTIDQALKEVPGLDVSAMERLALLKSGMISFTGYFNTAANAEHDALDGLPTADVVACLLTSTTLGDAAAGIEGKQVGYGWDRPADGSLGISSEIQGDGDFISWGKSLTAGKRTDSSATNGTGVDFGLGDLSFGMVAYAHVFTVTGTSVTLTIEESTDDGSGDAYAAVTGGAFAAVTSGAAPAAERIETSLTQTVEDWLRVASSGTFSNAQFAVVAKIYQAANAER